MPQIDILKRDETVNIPVTELKDLIRKEERIECLREYIQGTEYIERKMVAKILGFEIPGKEENEEESNLPFPK